MEAEGGEGGEGMGGHGREREAGPALCAGKAALGFLVHKLFIEIYYKIRNKIELFYSIMGRSLDGFKQENSMTCSALERALGGLGAEWIGEGEGCRETGQEATATVRGWAVPACISQSLGEARSPAHGRGPNIQKCPT